VVAPHGEPSERIVDGEGKIIDGPPDGGGALVCRRGKGVAKIPDRRVLDDRGYVVEDERGLEDRVIGKQCGAREECSGDHQVEAWSERSHGRLHGKAGGSDPPARPSEKI
jgi:hypothetical protein